MPALDLPPWCLSILLFPFGLVLGSFGNVLIHRLPQEEEKDRNVVTVPSHCPSCKAPIRWYHNIPLISWIVLRGKCASCGWRIPVRYPLVELLSGLLMAGSVWVFPFGTLVWFKGAVCAYALLVLFFTDLTEFILPDVLQFPLMAFGLLCTVPQMLWPGHVTRVSGCGWNLLLPDLWANVLQQAPAFDPLGRSAVTWLDSLLGLALGYGIPWLFNAGYKLVRKTDGLGMGDFKMLAWLGAFWGWPIMLGILGGATFLAVAFALPLMVTGKVKGRTMLPLGCFMALATFPILFWGPAAWLGYMGFMGR